MNEKARSFAPDHTFPNELNINGDLQVKPVAPMGTKKFERLADLPLMIGPVQGTGVNSSQSLSTLHRR